MPSKPRPGVSTLYVEIPTETKSALEALASQTGRTLKSEVMLALRWHVAAGPRIAGPESAGPARPDTPAPAPESPVDPEPRRPRGRPRKPEPE